MSLAKLAWSFRSTSYTRKIVAMGCLALTAFSGVFLLGSGHAESPALEIKNTGVVLSQSAPKPDKKSTPVAAPAKPKPSTAPAVVPSIPPLPPAHPWSVTNLYTNPVSDAASQARIWAASRPADAAVMARLAAVPQAMWFGDWNSNIQNDVAQYVGQAAAAGAMPVLVAYNIPGRDCGNYSAGGADDAASYAAWMQAFAQGIAGRPAVVILEPDALPMLTTCLTANQQQERLQMLQSATSVLKANALARVYLDAGNVGFQPAATMAPRLNQAGISKADGFALNVSNFYRTTELVTYGTNLSAMVGNKHFVIDTSRNGNGILSGEAWCNPAGRALGSIPTAQPGLGGLVDATLWIKTPGQSDGACNGGPNAGVWWPDYALGLARNAGW